MASQNKKAKQTTILHWLWIRQIQMQPLLLFSSKLECIFIFFPKKGKKKILACIIQWHNKQSTITITSVNIVWEIKHKIEYGFR